ncbi:hypothetical protein ACFCYB_35495, partial [Streptomyces sp. NPDC056309]|uniref:hypothetical protein n=1 Tax=unclassified Streptomyces TaxID=2593676 RepID=UPI0035E1CCDF
GAATIKPSRKPVTSGDTFSRTSHDRNYSCGDGGHAPGRWAEEIIPRLEKARTVHLHQAKAEDSLGICHP